MSSGSSPPPLRSNATWAAPILRIPVPTAPVVIRDTGLGPMGPAAARPTVVATASLLAGQPIVVVAAPPGAQVASSAAFPSAYVEGLAAAATASGYPVQIVRDALTLSDWTIVTGQAQLTIGRDYFLAPAGHLSLLPDTASGHCTVRVGRALSATTLILDISAPFLN